MGRNRYRKNKASAYVARIIGEHYAELRSLLCRGDYGDFLSRSYEDIFSDTVVFVIQDREAAVLHTDKEIIDHFIYRYRMIEYQTIKDSQQIKEIPYADYLQTQKKQEECE